LTFRLLCRGVEFQAKRLAGGVFKYPTWPTNGFACVARCLPSLILKQNG
jgi:hypothetical protein